VHARLVATLLGSALALAAYVLWPTWEGRRVGANLGRLIDAYRHHLTAVCSGSITQLVDSRAAARRARTNAQASLERLRAEPRRRAVPGELKKAESILANASRLIRATVMLEAQVRDGRQLPGGDQMLAFSRQADVILRGIGEALREDRAAELPPLRPTERRLHATLAPLVERDDAAATAMDDACDRIADSVDTLAHLLHPGAGGAATAASAAIAG
jgi:uncharacterized membrane protein YccC